MIDHPTTPAGTDDGEAARRARAARVAASRGARRRHPARGARITAAGLGATTMLSLVGVMGYRAHQAPDASPSTIGAPAEQPRIVVVVHPSDPGGSPGTQAAPSQTGTTTLEARPTVRPASPQAQAPTATTHGSH
jgi:hypothetical protein